MDLEPPVTLLYEREFLSSPRSRTRHPGDFDPDIVLSRHSGPKSTSCDSQDFAPATPKGAVASEVSRAVILDSHCRHHVTRGKRIQPFRQSERQQWTGSRGIPGNQPVDVEGCGAALMQQEDHRAWRSFCVEVFQDMLHESMLLAGPASICFV